MAHFGAHLGQHLGAHIGSVETIPIVIADPPPNAVRSPRLAVSIACAPAPQVLVRHDSVHVHIVKVTHG